MNAKPPTKDSKLWYQPPGPTEMPVPGYEAWLDAELAAGIADIEAGRVTPLEDVRKEFGLE